jgi:hypothetical protein
VTYSVVNVGDERDPIFSIIHTSPDGGQQVVALQVTPGYADKIAHFLNATDSNGHPLPSGKRSIESLSHFSCPHCKSWFSISQAPTGRTRWACPWCFVEGEYYISAEDLVKGEARRE